MNGPCTAPGTWRALETLLARVTSAGFPSSLPLLSAVLLKGSVVSGCTSTERVLCSKRKKGEKLKNFPVSSRKNTHLKVQMVPHVMSAPDHIL